MPTYRSLRAGRGGLPAKPSHLQVALHLQGMVDMCIKVWATRAKNPVALEVMMGQP